MIDRRDFEASFRYAPFGFKILPTAHSFWVFPDCTFLDNSNDYEFNNTKIKFYRSKEGVEKMKAFGLWLICAEMLEPFIEEDLEVANDEDMKLLFC